MRVAVSFYVPSGKIATDVLFVGDQLRLGVGTSQSELATITTTLGTLRDEWGEPEIGLPLPDGTECYVSSEYGVSAVFIDIDPSQAEPAEAIELDPEREQEEFNRDRDLREADAMADHLAERSL